MDEEHVAKRDEYGCVLPIARKDYDEKGEAVNEIDFFDFCLAVNSQAVDEHVSRFRL